MTADEARGTLWSDLVNGLLDVRTDLASARFDAELAAAVAAGELSRQMAQRLRFWQRAAVNAADDHARTVVPAVLAVLDTARCEAQEYVEHGYATLAAPDEGPDHRSVRRTPEAAPAGPVRAPHVGTDQTFRLADPQQPRAVPGRPPTAAQQAEVGSSPAIPEDDVRRASTAAADGPSTLEEFAPRLFLADLRDIHADRG